MPTLLILLAWALAALAVPDPAFAGFDGAWSELAPPQRSMHFAVVDSTRGRLLLFGGDRPSGANTDVWSLGLGLSIDWKRVAIPPAPGALIYAQGFADPARDRVVIAGQYATSIGSLNLANGFWDDRTPTSWPVASIGAATVFDPVRDRLICFGGQTGCAPSPCVHDTLWEVRLSGEDSFNLLAATGPAPPPRTRATAVYDPVRDRMIVFGGLDSLGTPLADMWALDLSPAPHWEALTPSGSGPPAWPGQFVGYDPLLDQAMFFADYASTQPFTLWGLSLSGSPAWTHVNPAGPPPIPGYGSAVTLDLARRRLLLNGGLQDAGQTWALTLGAGASWRMIDAPPAGRSYFGTAYDGAGDRTLIFGGIAWAGCASEYFNDVWARDYGAQEHWESIAPSGTPPAPRSGPMAAMDPVSRRMIIFGGEHDTSPFEDADTWALALTPAPAWVPMATAGPHPAARTDGAMVYDPQARRMIVFGGASAQGTLTAFNDTWALALDGTPAWGALPVTGTPPSPRYLAQAVYDSRRQRMLVLGGNGTANNADQLWALSLTGTPTWSRLAAVNDPGNLVWQVAYYDSVQDRIVALGPNATPTDVWALSLGGPPTWSQLSVFGSRPSGRFNECGFIDPLRNRVMSIGGYLGGQGCATVYDNDLWALTLLGPGTDAVPPAPRTTTLAITAVWPNPTRREWSVSFSLPRPEHARIELLDVTGRRLESREVGTMGVGPYTIRMGGSSPLPLGLYFIRLSQSGASSAVRAAITR